MAQVLLTMESVYQRNKAAAARIAQRQAPGALPKGEGTSSLQPHPQGGCVVSAKQPAAVVPRVAWGMYLDCPHQPSLNPLPSALHRSEGKEGFRLPKAEGAHPSWEGGGGVSQLPCSYLGPSWLLRCTSHQFFPTGICHVRSTSRGLCGIWGDPVLQTHSTQPAVFLAPGGGGGYHGEGPR